MGSLISLNYSYKKLISTIDAAYEMETKYNQALFSKQLNRLPLLNLNDQTKVLDLHVSANNERKRYQELIDKCTSMESFEEKMKIIDQIRGTNLRVRVTTNHYFNQNNIDYSNI